MNRIPSVVVALALVAYGFAPCSADEASCQAEFKTVFMDKKVRAEQGAGRTQEQLDPALKEKKALGVHAIMFKQILL